MKKHILKKPIAFLLAVVMALSLLPVSALADGEDLPLSASIAVTTDGEAAANTVTNGAAYQVVVSLHNNRTYAISPTLTLYVVRDGKTDIAVDGLKSAGELAADAQKTLAFTWRPAVAGNATLKVKATMEGQAAPLDIKEYSVAVEAASPVDAAASSKAALIAYYQKNSLHCAFDALGMRALTGDAALGGASVNIPYYGNTDGYYSYPSASPSISSSEGMAALDYMARGLNPREYPLVSVTGDVTETDLIQVLLNKQDPVTGKVNRGTSNAQGNTAYGELVALLALETYFGGKAWGNEKDGTKLGRTGGIEYFLSTVADSTYDKSNASWYYGGWKLDGGKVYTGNKSFGWAQICALLPMQADAVVLLARWLNDDTNVVADGENKPLKSIASSYISGLLKTLDTFYEKDKTAIQFLYPDEGLDWTAFYGYNDAYANTQMISRYISALIAAGKQDEIDNEMLNFLLSARLEDGSFQDLNNRSDEKYRAASTRDTAQAAIAIGDYLTGTSLLKELKLDKNEITDEYAVSRDLKTIVFPQQVTDNLKLQTAGFYGSSIAWTSSNPDVIDPVSGAVTRPLPGAPNATVVLTATVTRGEVSAQQSFTIIVPANQTGLDADFRTLSLPLFVTDNMTLLSTGAQGSTITWVSSDSSVIENDGTVHRSAEKDLRATLTATLSSNGVEKTKAFPVTVGKNATDLVTKAMETLRKQYETKRELTGSYWDVWAAKSVLGEDFDNYGFSVYNINGHRLGSSWQNTDYGAVVLQIIAQGDNPYNYQGKDYIQLLLNNIATNGWGSYGSPIYAVMALDAAGASTPELVGQEMGYFRGQTKDLTLGPDLGSWSLIPLATHLSDPGVKDASISDITNFVNTMINKVQTSSSSNVEKGMAKVGTMSGASITMSNACIVSGMMALTALNDSDIKNIDLRTGTTWTRYAKSGGKLQSTGYGVVNALYDLEIKDKTSFNPQIAIAFGDMYYSDSMYRRIAVKTSDMDALMVKAKAAGESSGEAYTAKSFASFKAAYDNALKVKEIGTPAFGKAYYTLRDAYDGLKPAGSVSVRVLGASSVLYDTQFVTAKGSVLDVLGQYAADYKVSQTATTSAVQEIGGLKGEWRVYNGETRVTDLTAPLGEGAELTFKYTPNPSAVPETATLEEHFIRETAAGLTIPASVTGNITLPSSGAFGTTVSWKSSNSLYLNASTGAVTRVANDVAVTLTATVSGVNGATVSVPFSLTIKGSGGSKESMTIRFKLLGAPNDGEHGTLHMLKTGNLETWLDLSYTFEFKSVSAENAFKVILAEHGIEWEGNSKNSYGTLYISGVQNPINGEWMREMTTTPNSGWMYAVNGQHPTVGVSGYTLYDGDVLIVHFTDDYTQEEGSEKLSDTETGTNTTLSPVASVTNGIASATVSLNDLRDAIVNAKTSDSNIIIAPAVSGAVSVVKIMLDKDAVNAIGQQTNVGLTVQTSVGTVTLPNAALDSITSQASGSSVTISLGTVDNATLTVDQQKAVGISTVYDISVLSGSAKISSFGGNSISISLPYTLKEGESASGVTVWYMDDSGKLQQMTATYDKATGMATFSTTHLSYYVVGYTAPWTNPFGDVKTTDWFYDAVKYVSQNSLMSGTSTTTFDPNSNMTRAMLVTVLYRMEGKPAVTGTNSFTDVKSGEWYTDAVIWATANKIVGGYGGSLFGTDDSVTREQLAVILMNYASYKKYDTTKTTELRTFTDAASIDSWATAAMKWAVAEGLITGRTTTTLTPTGTAVRGEVASILMRFVENVTK